MSRPADFNPHKLAEALQGTCTTIDEHLPEGMDFIDLTSSDHDIIANEVFHCEQCGWWCEQSEAHENGDDGDICTDCYEDR